MSHFSLLVYKMGMHKALPLPAVASTTWDNAHRVICVVSSVVSLVVVISMSSGWNGPSPLFPESPVCMTEPHPSAKSDHLLCSHLWCAVSHYANLGMRFNLLESPFPLSS